uniref:Uncharacterized protein n=1 Tax=Aegilops tauschii subsp. strangulata TaxID=200361 RepID=A0A453ND25_AEGTS
MYRLYRSSYSSVWWSFCICWNYMKQYVEFKTVTLLNCIKLVLSSWIVASINVQN